MYSEVNLRKWNYIKKVLSSKGNMKNFWKLHAAYNFSFSSSISYRYCAMLWIEKENKYICPSFSYRYLKSYDKKETKYYADE